jgi:spermidine synthase
MAIVWQKTRDGIVYQIRNAGSTLRLYTDNVLHSQFNPNKRLTGSVWDLLFLPALCHLSKKPLRVLVLGVGGGAVIKMLNEFVDCDDIVGLELNPTHIEIAQRFFELSAPNIQLIHADAVQWVENKSSKIESAEKFDVIIDDLFFEEANEPVKVATPNATWFYTLYSLLKPNGLIIMNFVGRHSAMTAAPLHDDYVAKLLPNTLHLTTPHYDNHVLAFSKQMIGSKMMREKIEQHKVLKKLQHHLRFSCRNL